MSIIVNCPACGAPTSIEPEFYGRKLRCATETCGQLFRVQADGSVSMEISKAKSAKTVNWQNPPAQEAHEGDWLAAPPPRPGGQPMHHAGSYDAMPPMASITPVGSSYASDDEDYSPGNYEYGRKKNRFLVILIGLVILLLGASGFGYWLWQQNLKTGLADLKKQINDSFDKRRWAETIEKGNTYRSKTKDDAEIKELDFKIAWSQMQQEIVPSSITTPDAIKKAGSSIINFYRVRKNDPLFRPLKKDMVESAYAVVKAGSDVIENSPSPDATLHDTLKPVLEVAREAASDIPDKDQINDWANEAEKKYTAARAAIDAGLAKKTWQVRMEDVLAKENLGQIDALQAEYHELTKQHPLLLKDVDLTSKVGNLKTVEPTWVKYTGSNSAPTPNKTSFGPSIRICPPVKTPEGVQDDQGIVLAMARGTLYGLSARTGKDRWALRVGQDVRELPPRITLGGDAADIAFVVTNEDAGQTYLSQMNIMTGERNWMRKLAGPCPAGPVLISNNRLVVPLKETIAIVEAGTGKMTGFFTISGYDISTQPAHDKVRDRLFVPVDRGRIFVIDLKDKKCISVIYTEHGTGQIKGSPVVIDDLMVVCIASGSGQGSTRIRAFDISAKGNNPAFELIGTYDMPGHASTSPYLDGSDTLGVVSDLGQLWLFGIGKSSTIGTAQSRGSTPFYPLTAKPMMLKLQANAELSKDKPRPRVQVAHVALNDWWVFSHDYLLRNVFDPFRGILSPSPMGSLPLGSPLHRAELSSDSRLIVIVTQPKGQAQMLASGIDRTNGKVIWQTQLGTEASQDPVAMADAVAMLDRGGAVFAVKASDIKSDNNWQVTGTWPALPLAAASHRLVKSVGGQALVSLSFDAVRSRMIIRRMDLASNGPAQIKEFPHNLVPVGTPVALDDGTTLAPCKDGNIYLFNFTTGASQSVFSWRDPAALSNAFSHLLMPSPNLLLASNGLNKVLRWQRESQGVWKKLPNDLEVSARIITPFVPLSGNRVAVGDDAGNLHCLSLAALGTSKQWTVKGAITKGPFKVGAEGVGCIVDGRRLWWINSADEEEGKVFGGNDTAAMIGEATSIGDDLLIAVLKRDSGLGMIASYVWLSAADGKVLHAERLPEGLAPSSSATALGKNRAFAPLSDGTVRILIKPEATAAVH